MVSPTISPTSSPTLVLPRYGPTRRTDRPNLGERFAKMGRVIGQPLMPWQEHVATIGTELVRDDVAGMWVPAYRTVVITVARQNGKTMMVLVWELDRCVAWGTPQTVIYTAQTGKDARQKLLNDQMPIVKRSPLDRLVDAYAKAKGEEAISFRSGSRIGVEPTTDHAGHGKTAGLVVLDELFKDTDSAREGALNPTQRTVPDAQALKLSTMGTDASIPWNRTVEAGRQAALEDKGHGIAFFEWSAPEDADSDDVDAWLMANPALGHTITMRTLRADRDDLDEPVFRRTVMNITDSSADDRPIPAAVWARVQSPSASPSGDLVLGVERAMDNSAAALVVADSAGRVEVVAYEPGVGWVEERVVRLAKERAARVVIDPRGPAATHIAGIVRAGVAVEDPTSMELAQWCTKFVDCCADGRLSVRPHPALDAAVEAARRRWSTDIWFWGRKDTISDVSPLVAATWAVGLAVSVEASSPFFM